MPTQNDGGLAFPTAGDQSYTGPGIVKGGMSLRDFFACVIATGSYGEKDKAATAKAAYEMADAMLAQRTK